MKPSELLELLAVPGTNTPPHVIVTETANGEPYLGWVEDWHGNVIGRLREFRFDFVDVAPLSDEERARANETTVAPLVRRQTFIEPTDPRLVYCGPWFDVAGYLQATDGDDLSAVMRFQTEAPCIELQFHAHPWSGICEIERNGQTLGQLDLYCAATAVPRGFGIENPAQAPMQILVRPMGQSAPHALGRQVILEGIREFHEEWVPPSYQKSAARNRGSPFSSRFFEILQSLPADGVVLDVGGGKRQIDDRRYLNLEYAPYEEPDIFGDALNLPFLDKSIDFVYSAAVLEHLRDPHRAGAEMYRVLKPGGYLLANSAFMQPVHSEGQHFFNLTPYGIAEVFKLFDQPKISWDGDISFLFNWLVDVSGIKHRADPADITTMNAILARFDDLLSYEGLKYIASGVWLEARK